MLNIDPNPDFERLKTVINLEGEPDRVPFYELFADPPIMEVILGRKVPGEGPYIENIEDLVEYQYQLGYDYVTVILECIEFPTKGEKSITDAAKLSQGERVFNVAGMGAIHNWEDYEKYPWPSEYNIDYSPIDHADKVIPEGMKLIVRLGYIFETVMKIMGIEGLSFALYEKPRLVKVVFDRIGEIFLRGYEVCAEHEAVGALEISDDLGFKTQTFVSPEVLREYVFPWYKKFIEAAHAHEVPVIMHSCGQLDEIYDDIIDCGVDAKHSYEDQILRPEEAEEKFGDKMAVMGGIDVDFLCRATEDEVRRRTREVLEKCMPGGGYALGTGNTVVNYMPVDNFLAMLDEGWKCGFY